MSHVVHCEDLGIKSSIVFTEIQAGEGVSTTVRDIAYSTPCHGEVGGGDQGLGLYPVPK